MVAAVYRRPGVVEVEERPVPVPGVGEVLVEVDRCGICGSDIHMLRDGWGGKPGLIAGHEFTGTIAAIGDGVDGWEIGRHVVPGPQVRCGRCRRCREGRPSQCENRESGVADHVNGAFARYTVVAANALIDLPDGLSPRVAALAEPLAVAMHGITRSGIGAGDSAMVFGMGPIGALTLTALLLQGHGPVTAVEVSDTRKELAHRLGADWVVDPSELESFEMWEPERIAKRAVHVALECSGKKAAMEAGFQQLRRGGTLVLVGAGLEPPAFDPNRLLLNELTVTGAFIYDEGGFEAALSLLCRDDFPANVLIEDQEVTLDGLNDAMEGLATGRIAGKVMVRPTVSS